MLASCCNVDVIKGAEGFLLLILSSIKLILNFDLSNTFKSFSECFTSGLFQIDPLIDLSVDFSVSNSYKTADKSFESSFSE